MMKENELMENILSQVGINVNGDSPWDIKIKDKRTYNQVLQNKSLGLGETYMEGWWECSRIDELICKILKARLDEKVRGNVLLALQSLKAVLCNLQSKVRAPIVADRHYNLDNELFTAFLDPYVQYSCGYFDDTEDLYEAQLKKMNLISRKINLDKGDHVLDIGCGWGGLAKYLAQTYGCKVTAINIADEQINFARELCKDLPVEVKQCDYRDLSGSYDKIVSVGMFEHVGPKNYRTFMKIAHQCLKKDGIFLLHTIGSNESSTAGDPWINKYIFPNGKLPSIGQISRSIEGLFVMEDLHNLGPHYEKTLMAWHTNFQNAWSKLRTKYDEKFKRMFEYYLLSSAGSFRARNIQVWQIVLTKYRSPQPVCR
jgi:cyclopropane-fatty-acyl-phospholipid synthase